MNKGIAKVWNRNKEKELLHCAWQRVSCALWEEWLIGKESRRFHRDFKPRRQKTLPVDPNSSH